MNKFSIGENRLCYFAGASQGAVSESPDAGKISPSDLANKLQTQDSLRGKMTPAQVERALELLRENGSKKLDKNHTVILQALLKNAGHDPRGLDGIIGKNTRAAIRALQTSRGLKETGQYSPELLTAFSAQAVEELTGAHREAVEARQALATYDRLKLIDEMTDRISSPDDGGEARVLTQGDYEAAAIDVTHQPDFKKAKEFFAAEEEARVAEQNAATAQARVDELENRGVDTTQATARATAAQSKAAAAREKADGLRAPTTTDVRSATPVEIRKLTPAEIKAGFYYDSEGHIQNRDGGEYYENTDGKIIMEKAPEVMAVPQTVVKRNEIVEQKLPDGGTQTRRVVETERANVAVIKPADYDMPYKPVDARKFTENGFYFSKSGAIRRINMTTGRPYSGQYFERGGHMIYVGGDNKVSVLDKNRLARGEFDNQHWIAMDNMGTAIRYAQNATYRDEVLRKQRGSESV